MTEILSELRLSAGGVEGCPRSLVGISRKPRWCPERKERIWAQLGAALSPARSLQLGQCKDNGQVRKKGKEVGFLPGIPNWNLPPTGLPHLGAEEEAGRYECPVRPARK